MRNINFPPSYSSYPVMNCSLGRLRMKGRSCWQLFLIIGVWVLTACATETETVPAARTRPAVPTATTSATPVPFIPIEPEATLSDLFNRPVVVTVVVTETPTAKPEAKELTVCQVGKPDTLYPFRVRLDSSATVSPGERLHCRAPLRMNGSATLMEVNSP